MIDMDNLPLDVSALLPSCGEILTMKVELLFAPLLEREGGRDDGMTQEQADLMTQIDKFLPFDSPLECIATQNVAMRRVSSGLHEYVPVRFFLSFRELSSTQFIISIL